MGLKNQFWFISPINYRAFFSCENNYHLRQRMLIPFLPSKSQQENQAPNAPFDGHHDINPCQSIKQNDTSQVPHTNPENLNRKQRSDGHEVGIASNAQCSRQNEDNAPS